MVDYIDPLIRAVYGFPPLYYRLHVIEKDGVRRLLVMADWQCEALLQDEPGSVCVPWAIGGRKSALARTSMELEGINDETEEESE